MAQPQEQTGAEDFDAVFAQFADLDEGKEPAPAVTPVEEPAPAVAEEADDAADAEAPAEGADDDTEVAEEDVQAPVEATLSDEDLLARFAALVKKAEPAPRTEPTAAPVQQVAEEAPLYTKEEEDFLKTYEADWPDVSKAESLRRRAEYRQLVGYVFQEVAKEFRPMREVVEVLSQRTHLSDLQSTVSDYEDVRDKVVSWVETQPAYLQAAYKHVINSGTVEEVSDLIDRYKRENAVAPRPTQAPAKKEAELPTATRQAAAALAPVSSKRSAVVQAADPNDFEAAFASFADKL